MAVSNKQYNPTHGPLRTALRFTGTVIPQVFSKCEFWLFFAFHCTITILYRTGILAMANQEDNAFYIPWKDVKVVTAITTFLIVFYSNQCYSRYMHMFSLSRNILGSLYDITHFLRLFVAPVSKPHARLAVRLMLGMVDVFFYDTNDDDLQSDAGWTNLLSKGLLKEDEWNFLQRLNKAKRRLVIQDWTLEVIRDGFLKAVAEMHVPANILKDMISKVLEIRAMQQQVLDTLYHQVPFQYFHLLNVMLSINMLLWAYAMGVTGSIFAPMVYFCAAGIFCGMMELASQLTDPFGFDEVDFPVATWVAEFLENSEFLIEFNYPGAADGWKTALIREAGSQEEANALQDSGRQAGSPDWSGSRAAQACPSDPYMNANVESPLLGDTYTA